MRYDFRKVQEAIDHSGKTFREVEALSGVDETTICRVLRTGRAAKSTALRLTNAFRISMKDIQIQATNGNGNGKKSE
jgi:hypothetical protein